MSFDASDTTPVQHDAQVREVYPTIVEQNFISGPLRPSLAVRGGWQSAAAWAPTGRQCDPMAVENRTIPTTNEDYSRSAGLVTGHAGQLSSFVNDNTLRQVMTDGGTIDGSCTGANSHGYPSRPVTIDRDNPTSVTLLGLDPTVRHTSRLSDWSVDWDGLAESCEHWYRQHYERARSFDDDGERLLRTRSSVLIDSEGDYAPAHLRDPGDSINDRLYRSPCGKHCEFCYRCIRWTRAERPNFMALKWAQQQDTISPQAVLGTAHMQGSQSSNTLQYLPSGTCKYDRKFDSREVEGHNIMEESATAPRTKMKHRKAQQMEDHEEPMDNKCE